MYMSICFGKSQSLPCAVRESPGVAPLRKSASVNIASVLPVKVSYSDEVDNTAVMTYYITYSILAELQLWQLTVSGSLLMLQLSLSRA